MSVQADFERFFAKLNFGVKRRRMLYKKLANFLDGGIDLYTGLKMISRRAAETKDLLQPMYRQWLRRMDGGMEFSDAIRGWVSEDERMLIVSGERGSNIARGIAMASELAQRMAELRAAVFTELRTPGLLALVLVTIIMFVSFKVVPGLSRTIPRRFWPSELSSVGHMSDAVRAYWWSFGLAIASGIAAFTYSLGRWKGRVRELVDRFVPPYPIYREIRSAGFLIALSGLMSSGIDLNESIKVIERRSNSWMSSYLKRSLGRLSAGQEPGQALNTGLFDKDVARDLIDFGRMNKFEVAIEELGRNAATDTGQRIERFAAVARMVIMSMVAFSIVFGYSAVYQLQSAAKAQAMHAQRP